MCVIEEKNISIIIELICLENLTTMFQHVILWCYFMMLFYDVILWCYFMMLFYDVISRTWQAGNLRFPAFTNLKSSWSRTLSTHNLNLIAGNPLRHLRHLSGRILSILQRNNPHHIWSDPLRHLRQLSGNILSILQQNNPYHLCCPDMTLLLHF